MVAPIGPMVEILSELNALASAASAPVDNGPAAATSRSAEASFADLFSAAVNRLDGDISSANTKARDFASGSDIPLSDVMLSLEQANLGLQMAATVRDKVVAAYSNIMNMPL